MFCLSAGFALLFCPRLLRKTHCKRAALRTHGCFSGACAEGGPDGERSNSGEFESDHEDDMIFGTPDHSSDEETKTAVITDPVRGCLTMSAVAVCVIASVSVSLSLPVSASVTASVPASISVCLCLWLWLWLCLCLCLCLYPLLCHCPMLGERLAWCGYICWSEMCALQAEALEHARQLRDAQHQRLDKLLRAREAVQARSLNTIITNFCFVCSYLYIPLIAPKGDVGVYNAPNLVHSESQCRPDFQFLSDYTIPYHTLPLGMLLLVSNHCSF